MSRIVFVFVDGLGLGDPDSPDNPLRHPELTILANFLPPGWRPPANGGPPPELPEVERPKPLPHDGIARATDASLGLPDLPQSATGQTALLTGVNAARVLGRHLYGVPTRTLQKILMEHSVLKRVAESGGRAAFLNAFRPLFFELGEKVWSKGMSATTWANRAAGLPFRTVEDLVAGRAVYQDITNESLRARRIEVPARAPEEAGGFLAAASSELDFAVFEFFQTDKAGHARDMTKAAHELLKLERFLWTALGRLDLDSTTLILTSDHGNVEDLGVKTHTLNPVPTLLFGERAAALAPRLAGLDDFTPTILAALGASGSRKD